MSITSSDQDSLLVFDGTDNPVGLLTDFATNSFTYTYNPWGMQTLTASESGNGATQNPYAFHGGIKNKGSGLVKFGNRWYNPVTGTWTEQNTLDAPLDPVKANLALTTCPPPGVKATALPSGSGAVDVDGDGGKVP